MPPLLFRLWVPPTNISSTSYFLSAPTSAFWWAQQISFDLVHPDKDLGLNKVWTKLNLQMIIFMIHVSWSSTKTAQITPENHLFVFSNKNGSLNSSWPLHCIRSHLNAQRCIRPPKNLIFQEVTRCHEYRVNHCQLTRHLHYMEA